MNIRDQARKNIEDHGITVQNVTESQLSILYECVKEELKKSPELAGSLRIQNRKPSTYLECKAHYFKKREAISFNRDGFIGIAGWADKINVMPFIRCIDKWLWILDGLESDIGGRETYEN